jgi:UDPglucose 6-dehydrogenase
MINAQRAPFFEPGLEEALARSVQSKHLRAETSRSKAVSETDVSFITVATPEQTDGTIDLRYVIRASEDIGQALRDKDAYHLIVVKSTVTPGTTRDVVKPALERTSHLLAGPDFGLCMNPEFLRQGSAIDDTRYPDRVVIGAYDERSSEQLEDLLSNFHEHSVPILKMNLEAAEMVKYASNTFLAAKISYANEMANVCERVPGVDVIKVLEGVGLDRRINPQFLSVGAGFGGSCLPKDTKALLKFAGAHSYEAPLLRAVLAVNDAQARRVVQLTLSMLGEPKGKRVALLGLAFKPDTDDLREAASLKIARALMDAGVNVIAFDPVVRQIAFPGFEGLRCADSIPACLEGTHCAVIVTEWEQFKTLTPVDFIKYMATPTVIDARRIYDPQLFSHKLAFTAIGLGEISPSTDAR